MADEPTASGRLDRRDLLKGALAAGFASGLAPHLPAAPGMVFLDGTWSCVRDPFDCGCGFSTPRSSAGGFAASATASGGGGARSA